MAQTTLVGDGSKLVNGTAAKATPRTAKEDGNGKRAAPMTNPIAKRLRKAPINAAFLSGNDKGTIEAADNAP